MVILITFALIAACSNSVQNLANKAVIGRGGLAAMPAALLMQILAALGGVAFLVVLRPPLATAGLPYLAAVSVVSVGSYLLVLAALALEDASTVGPILGLKVFFLALLESALLGHPLGRGVLLGAVVSMAGLALISQTDHWSLHPRDVLRPGILLMAASALGFAVCDIFMKHALAAWHGDAWATNLYLLGLMGVVAAIGTGLWSLRPGGLGTDGAGLRQALPMLLLSAGALFLTQYAIFTSFAAGGGQVTLSNIIYNTRALFVVGLAAALVLGRGSTLERAGWRAYAYRTSGALLTVAAIALALLVK